MEKIRTVSIKTSLYIFGALTILTAFLLTLLVENIIGYIEFTDFYQSQFTDFWHQPHKAIMMAHTLSGILVPFLTIVCFTHYFFNKFLKTNLDKLDYIINHLTKNDLQFDVPKSNIAEFDTIFKTSEIIKEELETKLLAQWQLDNTFKQNIAIMKHELNTPITIAQGHLNLVKIFLEKNHTNSDDFTLSEINMVQNNIEKIKSYVDDTLLLLTKTNKYPIDSVCTITSLETYIKTNYEPVAKMKNKKITIHAAVNLSTNVSLYGNQQAILHIVDNIMTNAIKFAIENIDIYFEISKDTVQFRFANDGRPFSEEELAHAFEENYKGENSTGSGIGLFFSKCLSTAIKSSIAVDNFKEQPITTLTIKRA